MASRGEPGQLVLAHWKDALTAAGSKPDKIFTKNFGSVPLSEDGGAYTLAYVAEGTTEIPAPSSAAEIQSLGAADADPTASAGTSTETVPVTEAPVEDTTETTDTTAGAG